MRKFRLLFIFMLSFPFIGFGKENASFSVLQWNIWQEGTQVEGGYDAIVNEIVRLKPDFVTLTEVRNYHNVNFIARLRNDLKAQGLTYYGFRSYDTGLLSKTPITDSITVFPEKDDHGSIYKLISRIGSQEIAVYTAHLDYLNDAYYDVRGYDGSTWKEISIPNSAEEVLRRNALSQRDEAMSAFLREAAKDRQAGRAIILGGDFNEPSHLDWTEKTKHLFDHHGLVIAWPQTKALEEAGFCDSYRTIYPDAVKHPGFTFPCSNPSVQIKRLTWAPKSDERERIDYLFFSPEKLRVTHCQVFGPQGDIAFSKRTDYLGKDKILSPLGIWPSDHKAVIAIYQLK